MILIIDCTQGLEFAFFKNKEIILKKKSKQLRNISEKLVVEIEKSLTKIGTSYKSIKKIVLVTGPGSFTGIRSAITFAKTINVYMNIKVLGISKFEVLNLLTIEDCKPGVKNILIKNNQNSFFLQKFDSSGVAKSVPELLDSAKKLIKFNHKTRIICDGLEFKKYLLNKKKTKTVKFLEIIDYKINDIYKVTKKLSEKNYIPKPLYTKNFF